MERLREYIIFFPKSFLAGFFCFFKARIMMMAILGFKFGIGAIFCLFFIPYYIYLDTKYPLDSEDDDKKKTLFSLKISEI